MRACREDFRGAVAAPLSARPTRRQPVPPRRVRLRSPPMKLHRAAPPPPDVRRRLAAELARRCAENPQYSLRAFALQLGLDHGTLGQMLRGRRAITARTVRELGARLRWPADDIERFAAAADAGAGGAPLEDLNQLSHDAAAVLADGAHAALLELVHLRDFRPDVRWIARVLGLSEDEVCVALQRLLRLGLLEMPAPDRWVDRAGDAVAD